MFDCVLHKIGLNPWGNVLGPFVRVYVTLPKCLAIDIKPICQKCFGMHIVFENVLKIIVRIGRWFGDRFHWFSIQFHLQSQFVDFSNCWKSRFRCASNPFKWYRSHPIVVQNLVCVCVFDWRRKYGIFLPLLLLPMAATGWAKNWQQLLPVFAASGCLVGSANGGKIFHHLMVRVHFQWIHPLRGLQRLWTQPFSGVRQAGQARQNRTTHGLFSISKSLGCSWPLSFVSNKHYWTSK